MDKTIFKYTFNIEGKIELILPKGAEILRVYEQFGVPCMWAVVDIDVEKETRVFRIVGTGHKIDFDIDKYIDTFLMANGNLVWHMFEIG